MQAGRVTRFVRRKLYDKLSLSIRPNSVYSKDDILDFLVHTAMLNNPTVTSGARYLRAGGRVIHPNTVFYHLYQLEHKEIKKMFEEANDGMLKIAKKIVGRKEIDVAIDTTDWLYYGEEVLGVLRVQPRDGTSKAFRFMTLNIVESGLRFTVAIFPVLPFTDEAKGIGELIEKAKRFFRVRCVYLDRHYFTVKAIAKLQELGVKFVIPAVKNRRVKELMSMLEPPAVVEYKMGNKYSNVKFNLFVIAGADGEKVTFASNLPKYYHSVIGEMYKKRWGIETSYRVKTGLRLKTCSRKYVVRYFMFAFSVLLYNAWVLLNLLISTLNGFAIPDHPTIEAQTFLHLVWSVQHPI